MVTRWSRGAKKSSLSRGPKFQFANLTEHPRRYISTYNRQQRAAADPENMSNFDHGIYKNDPVLLKSYVNKRCAVTTTDKCVHTGVVYTVDPVSESVVLVDESPGADSRLKIVIGHAVQQIDVLSSAEVDDPPQLFQQSITHIPESLVAERKRAVMSLLEENRFPVKEIDQALHIEGIVSIKPPYGIDDCVSTSPIVLTRIHNILSKLQ